VLLAAESDYPLLAGSFTLNRNLQIIQDGKAAPSTRAEIAQGDSGNLGKYGHEL
jgi:hypothetical protein